MSLGRSSKVPGRAGTGFAFVVLLVALLLSGRPAGAQKPEKNPKPEDIVEKVILAYGGRPAVYTVQKNGILKGLITFKAADGDRNGKTVTKFIRKPHLLEDLYLLDLELPDTKFVVGFDGERNWSSNNGEAQAPSAETLDAFRASRVHSYEALLRYKENEGKLEYVGNKTFSPGNELDVIDLTLPDAGRTRYEVSHKTYHIIYLEYDGKSTAQGTTPKYRLYFKDFRAIQNTLVPFVTLVFQDGKLIEERKLVEVAFGVQLEDAVFKVENAGKPTETASRP
jgi:hypothetical protein